MSIRWWFCDTNSAPERALRRTRKCRFRADAAFAQTPLSRRRRFRADAALLNHCMASRLAPDFESPMRFGRSLSSPAPLTPTLKDSPIGNTPAPA
jgi:hypothetical protein